MPAFIFVVIAGVPLWLLLAACVIGTDPPSVGLSKPRDRSSRLAEAKGYLLGWFVMMAITFGFAVLHAMIQRLYSAEELGGQTGWWLVDDLLTFTRFQSWTHFGAFTLFISIVVLLPVAATSFYPNIPPGLGICLLLCLASILYLCLDVLMPGVRIVVASILARRSSS